MGKSQSTSKSSNTNVTGKSSVVARGTSIKGNFTSTENIRVDGQIIGDVDCKKRLVIGVEGNVEGNVKAAEGTVQGSIIGDIIVTGMILLTSTAKLDGKLHAQKMEIEEGAIINGEISIGAARK